MGLVWCEDDNLPVQDSTWKPRCEARPTRSWIRQTLFSLHSPCLYVVDKTQCISLSLFSFLSILFRWAHNALKKRFPQARVCQLPFHKSDFDSSTNIYYSEYKIGIIEMGYYVFEIFAITCKLSENIHFWP